MRDEAIVEKQPEDFQGVTRNGLKIIGLTRLLDKFEGLRVTYTVLIAQSIAHKFILKTDFYDRAQVRHHKLSSIHSVRPSTVAVHAFQIEG